jgi:hypothetical protein
MTCPPKRSPVIMLVKNKTSKKGGYCASSAMKAQLSYRHFALLTTYRPALEAIVAVILT